MSIENSKVLIVGLARNCEQSVESSVSKLELAFKSAKQLNFLIVESDSSDETVKALNLIKSKNQNFDFVALGDLSKTHPKRTDRIALCRNYYISKLSSSAEYSDVDYVVVADMDGVNNLISAEAVKSCWARSDWEVCCANQLGPYYDIWALRHPAWSPNDCWAQVKYLRSLSVSIFSAIFGSVYLRMVTIPVDADWIPVESAFGGLAIYKRDFIAKVKYVGVAPDGAEVCEHVSIHDQIRELGGRIYINPSLINSGLVEHAKFATKSGVVIFWLRCKARDIAEYFNLLRIFNRG